MMSHTKKHSHKTYRYFLSIALLPLQAYSLTPSDEESQRIKHQQQLEQSDKAIQQAQQYLSDSSKLQSEFLIEKSDDASNRIESILIDLAGHSANFDFDPIIQRYQGAKLTNKNVLALVKELTDTLYTAGYVTSAIGLKSDKVINGQLELLVHWGKIDQLLVNGDIPSYWKDKGMLLTLPKLRDEIFNIHTVDQLIESLNNSNKTVSINVKASKEVAKSDLEFTTNRRKFPVVQLGFNNSGAEKNGRGRNQATATISMDDLFGVNDQWRFSMGHRFYQNHHKNSQNNYSISYSQPFSFYIFETRLSQSGYEKALQGINGEYQSSGKTKSANIKLSRILLRNKQNILSAYGDIEFKNKKNYVAHRQVSDRHEHKLNVGISYITNFLDGKLYSDFSYSNGLKWGNEDHLAFNAKGYKTLKTFNTSLTWFKPTSIFSTKTNYQLRVGAQYSPYSLFSENQFSLGDEYTVRGFKGGVTSGDSGIYAAQTLSVPIYTKHNVFKYFSPFIGFDIGKTHQRKEKKHETISGISTGIKMNISQLSLSLTYAKPLNPVERKHKTSIYYFNGNIEF